MRISKASFLTNRFPADFIVRKLVLVLLFLAAVSPVFANSLTFAGEAAMTNLRWRSGPIRIAISASLLRESANIKHDSDVAGAIKRSIETWSRVANIELRQTSSDKLSASPAGPAGDGISLITIAQTTENVLLFSKDPEGSAATTRIFYNRRGLITEADIVLNPYQQFSTDGTIGTFDLESTLTHELGHLLGLSHSEVLGSTMHANYGKNGVFGQQRLISRTLSADDIAAVRSLYGARGEETECCGSIEGRLTLPSKLGRTLEVWIEDLIGRVHGSSKVSSTGEFNFSGLTAGRYRVFAHEPGRPRNALPAQEVAVVTVTSGETESITAKAVGPGSGDLGLSYIGFNGQLSEMAVSLSPGRNFTIYLGGRNLDPKEISVGFNSPDLRVVPGTTRSLDYGDDISVIAFDVRVSARARNGEYSLFVGSRAGDRRAVIGGLTVDNYAAPGAGLTGFDD